MTRQKTITNEELLAVARKVFSELGHAAPTRVIARQAGISEGILYQRFGSKEELFFASMVPTEPDFEALLGPHPPIEDAHAFVRNVLVRMARYFAEVIPLALHVMSHPSFDRFAISRAQPALSKLSDGLDARLKWFEAQKLIRSSTAERTAQLLMSLAHDWARDWALGYSRTSRSSRKRLNELEGMAEIIWRGIAPLKPARASKHK
jgi:AcrR family transcriptional regulator